MAAILDALSLIPVLFVAGIVLLNSGVPRPRPSIAWLALLAVKMQLQTFAIHGRPERVSAKIVKA